MRYIRRINTHLDEDLRDDLHRFFHTDYNPPIVVGKNAGSEPQPREKLPSEKIIRETITDRCYRHVLQDAFWTPSNFDSIPTEALVPVYRGIEFTVPPLPAYLQNKLSSPLQGPFFLMYLYAGVGAYIYPNMKKGAKDMRGLIKNSTTLYDLFADLIPRGIGSMETQIRRVYFGNWQKRISKPFSLELHLSDEFTEEFADDAYKQERKLRGCVEELIQTAIKALFDWSADTNNPELTAMRDKAQNDLQIFVDDLEPKQLEYLAGLYPGEETIQDKIKKTPAPLPSSFH